MELLRIEYREDGVILSMATHIEEGIFPLALSVAECLDRDSEFAAAMISAFSLFLAQMTESDATTVLTELSEHEQKLRQKLNEESNENN